MGGVVVLLSGFHSCPDGCTIKTAKMTYQEQQKSPKWQKKRLQILNRDEFTCQECGNKELTLHVHHKHYNKGAKIWEYENWELTTLCEECHKKEHNKIPQEIILSHKEQELIKNIRKLDAEKIMPLYSAISSYCIVNKEIYNDTVFHYLHLLFSTKGSALRLQKSLDVLFEYEMLLLRVNNIEERLDI